MTHRLSLRIGITIGLHAPGESLWTNGIKQNALFLAKLFQGSPCKHEVLLLNTTDTPITGDLPWSREDFPTFAFEDGCDGLDVLIELGGQINAEQTARIKQQGTRFVSYCCGPEYVQNIEAIIFGRRLWDSIFINQAYDELWIIPQIYELNRGFLQTFRRCPARKVPFVWDPMALVSITGIEPHAGEYRPSNKPKRLTVIEPNIDVLKFCLYPVLIAELAFRRDPGKIAFLHVANTEHFVADDHEFSALMRQLDIVGAHKASFIGRVRTPDFLSAHTDVVISHQWGLALNYFYLEVCWQGYPLIHNADLISDLGYFYPEHDLEAGAAHLLSAVAAHDESWRDYTDLQRNRIQRFLATDPNLIARYDELLFALLTTGNPESSRERVV